MTHDNDKIMVPSVHMNGTSKEELLKQIEVAYGSLSKAMEALRAMAPHPRDYYVQPGGMPEERHLPNPALNAARQHRERCEALDKIIREIEVIGVGIMDQ